MWGPDRAKRKLDELSSKAKEAVGKITADADRREGQDEPFHGRAEHSVAHDRDEPGNPPRVPDE